MSESPSGKELFIVDNSISGWTGIEYLKQWTEVAKSMDIATGYFEIGALSELHGQWQKLDKIRILMGDEMTDRTNKAIRKAEILKKSDNALNASLEAAKDKNPFLKHVPEIIEGMRSGKIECRVYDKTKFHAKAYITHGKLAVVGSQALVGSSNFTAPGLTSNVELNVQVQSSREVAQLQEWFEHHWNEGVEVTDQVVKVIERHTKEYSPFEVYAKALQEYFKGHELTEAEWDPTSQMFGKLDRYQKEAYWSLLKIAKQHGGAFLCDGVGLGKTFVGLMLIEKLVVHEGKRVVLLAPKSAKEGVWETHLKKYLSHISGQGNDFSNLVVVSHTDLGRGGEWLERFKRMAELADAVIIDEAHHFRNPGRKGDEELGIKDSRYYQLYNLLDDSKRKKSVFLLTATPINNRLSDFRHMIELFSRRKEDFFARTLGVNNLSAHFNKMERDLRKKLGGDEAVPIEGSKEAEEILTADQIFQNLVVQRSRAYARQSQLAESGKAADFPSRKDPQVAGYSIRKTYDNLLTMFQDAFDPKDRKAPLFSLPMYYPLAWYKGPKAEINPFEENRQKQVVGLIRTNFLKRFESSITAFESSCERLMGKLLAFAEKHSSTPAAKKHLERWKRQNAAVLENTEARQRELWGEGDGEDEDLVTPEMLEDVEELSPDEYNIDEMLAETYLDLEQIIKFIEEARKFKPKNDDKLQKLIELLKSDELKGQKVLIFSEFADTVEYLFKQLEMNGITGLDKVHSGTKEKRPEILQRFAPYYNGKSSPELKAAGLTEIRVLICTDVLSEGLNLQDATKMINYDIHWNPVRLMQRIGRVDRRMNSDIEAAIKKDHPEQAQYRGQVAYWNFLPPAELNDILTLYRKVTQKTLLISETLGIEGSKLLTPDDRYKAIKEFNEAYEGTTTAVEKMHLEYQALIKENPNLEKELAKLPSSVFSGKKSGTATTGIFFCYALPALDNEKKEFTEAAGITRWYLYDSVAKKLDQEPSNIDPSIHAELKTPRKCVMTEKDLKDAKAYVEKHITNTYLKQLQAPMGVKPALKCWMEIN